MTDLLSARWIRRAMIGSGLCLCVLLGYRAVLAEPSAVQGDVDVDSAQTAVDGSGAAATPRSTPGPSSLHLLATGLLLVPAAHKLRLVPR